VLLALLVLLIPLAASGCSGTVTRGEYEREMRPIGVEVDEAVTALEPEELEPADETDVAAAARALGTARERAEVVVPPPSARAAHRTLLAGLEDLEGALELLATDLADAPDDSAARAAWLAFESAERSEQGFAALTRARETFEAEGFRVLAPSG